MIKLYSVLSLVALVILSGCDSQSGLSEDATQSIELSLSISPDAANAAAKNGTGLFGLVLSDGTNTLDISSVGIVLKKIEMEKVGGFDCDEFDHEDENEESGDHASESDEHNDDCGEFEVGPVLLEPALDGAVEHITSVEIPVGTYKELEFDIHKVSDGSQEGTDFLALHPQYDGISIRVEGTYNDVSFLFTQDLDEEQEIEFDTPLVVADGGSPVNITLHLDLSTWFVKADGMFVDPSEANTGGQFEALVESNIRQSIDVFEDDDHDGHHDDDHEGESDDD